MKHTPGPWKSVNSVKDRREFIIQANGGMLDLYQIAKVGSALESDFEISKATAQLIAAAPDLISVLKKWDEFMETNYSPEDISWWDEHKSAITKAEGK